MTPLEEKKIPEESQYIREIEVQIPKEPEFEKEIRIERIKSDSKKKHKRLEHFIHLNYKSLSVKFYTYEDPSCF